jgi:hypothetical protein
MLLWATFLGKFIMLEAVERLHRDLGLERNNVSFPLPEIDVRQALITAVAQHALKVCCPDRPDLQLVIKGNRMLGLATASYHTSHTNSWEVLLPPDWWARSSEAGLTADVDFEYGKLAQAAGRFSFGRKPISLLLASVFRQQGAHSSLLEYVKGLSGPTIEGSIYTMEAHSRMAREEVQNSDAIWYVICHEIGHHALGHGSTARVRREKGKVLLLGFGGLIIFGAATYGIFRGKEILRLRDVLADGVLAAVLCGSVRLYYDSVRMNREREADAFAARDERAARGGVYYHRIILESTPPRRWWSARDVWHWLKATHPTSTERLRFCEAKMAEHSRRKKSEAL